MFVRLLDAKPGLRPGSPWFVLVRIGSLWIPLDRSPDRNSNVLRFLLIFQIYEILLKLQFLLNNDVFLHFMDSK